MMSESGLHTVSARTQDRFDARPQRFDYRAPAPAASEPPETNDGLAKGLFLILLVSTLFLQKVALPATSSSSSRSPGYPWRWRRCSSGSGSTPAG